MSAAGSVSSEVGRRYATALIELAEETSKLDKVEQDLRDLQAMIAGADDLAAVIRSPLVNKSALADAMKALAENAKLQDVTKNFLGVLVKNRRLGALPAIIESFQGIMSARRGEVIADVQIAQDMSDAQLKELQSALSKAMGADVKVRARVEPSILGGMIVTVGSKMIDDSVRRKLEKLRLTMGAKSIDGFSAANTNTQSSKMSEVI